VHGPPTSLCRCWRCQARRCPLLCVVVDTSPSIRFRARHRHIRVSRGVRRRTRRHVSYSTRSAGKHVLADDAGQSIATLRSNARFESAVAISPLRCYVSILAANGEGAPAVAPSLIEPGLCRRRFRQYRRRTVVPPFIEPSLCFDGACTIASSSPSPH
jgi:hypothetical protein